MSFRVVIIQYIMIEQLNVKNYGSNQFVYSSFLYFSFHNNKAQKDLNT